MAAATIASKIALSSGFCVDIGPSGRESTRCPAQDARREADNAILPGNVLMLWPGRSGSLPARDPGQTGPGVRAPDGRRTRWRASARANSFDLDLQFHLLFETVLVTVADTEVAAVESAR